MAGVIDKLRKKNDKKSSADEWSKTGTLMKKPTRGWLHPDEQLAPSIGVCYGVRVGVILQNGDVLLFLVCEYCGKCVHQTCL